MTLREMYSSYSLLQRISKRKQISKTGGFACKKEPEYLIDILIYRCYSTNRTRERKKDQEIDRRSSDRFRNSPAVAGGQKVRGIERHRHMFNRKGEMTYVIT